MTDDMKKGQKARANAKARGDKQYNIWLPADMAVRLAQAAEEQDIAILAFIRRAIDIQIKEHDLGVKRRTKQGLDMLHEMLGADSVTLSIPVNGPVMVNVPGGQPRSLEGLIGEGAARAARKKPKKATEGTEEVQEVKPSDERKAAGDDFSPESMGVPSHVVNPQTPQASPPLASSVGGYHVDVPALVDFGVDLPNDVPVVPSPLLTPEKPPAEGGAGA